LDPKTTQLGDSSYSIDSDDKITAIDEAWLAFARSNCAPELERGQVIGESLWRYIADLETRYLYGVVLERVREHEAPIMLPFRCDSADRRRFMRLVVSPLKQGSIQIDSVLEREEKREAVRLLENNAGRSQDFIVMCSWCKQVQVSQDNWLEVEDAVVHMELFASEELPGITHGICRPCDLELSRILGLEDR
jgi:hypothetical protein